MKRKVLSYSENYTQKAKHDNVMTKPSLTQVTCNVFKVTIMTFLFGLAFFKKSGARRE